MSFDVYAPLAIAAADEYGLDPDIFLRQLNQESGFDPGADSGVAHGIAQFTDETAAAMGIDPRDPVASIDGAARLMRQYLDQYGNYADALVAYNAGPGAVGGRLPAETQTYLANILGDGGAAMAATMPTGGAPEAPGFRWPWEKDKAPEPTGPDPSDPATWSPQQRIDFLNTSGFQWISGNGPSALWTGPDGRTYTESNAFDVMLGRNAITDQNGKVISPAVRPNPPKPTSPTTGGAGALKINPDTGTWWRIGANGQAIDTHVPASGTASGGLPTLTQNPEYIQAQIAKTRSDLAQAQVAQQWLQRKQLFEEAQGLRQEARATRQQVIDLGVKIGELSANAIDRGREAATILATGFGQANRTPLFTDASLQPLASSLDARAGALTDLGNLTNAANQAQGQYDAFANGGVFGGAPPTTQTAPPAAPQPGTVPPASAPVSPSVAPTQPPQAAQPTAQPTAAPIVDPNLFANVFGGTAASAPHDAGILQNASQGQGTDIVNALMPFLQAARNQQLPAAAEGGKETGAYVSGERGPEINIPTEDGAIVINQEQAKHLGINLDKLKKYADGGIFSLGSKPAANPEQSIFGNDLQDTTYARGFLQKALQRAAAGTPFNPSALPAPVFASSPGMSPDVTQLLAGLNALAGLYSTQEYQRQANLLQPEGINAAPIRRSA